MSFITNLFKNSNVTVFNKHKIIQSVFQSIQSSPLAEIKEEYNGIYDNILMKNNNGIKNATTFSSHKHPTELVKIAEQKLKLLYPDSDIQIIEKHEYAGKSFDDHETALTDYRYITIDAKKSIDDDNIFIVDVLYRELIMLDSGDILKWTSPYVNYISTMLPPIFVGTIKELKQLHKDLEEIRMDDIYIKNDNLSNNMRWFDKPRLSHFNPY